MKNIILTLIVSLLLCEAVVAERVSQNQNHNWPAAGGPNGSWTTRTSSKVPTSWSETQSNNIRWKTVLPEGGQSGIAVWEDRLFFTINKPLPLDTSLKKTVGSDIIGFCLSTETGKVLWKAEIPSEKNMPHSGLFSDNTTPTPVTNGKHVWFINAGGRISCFDVNGKQTWTKTFESRTRHNAKQCEPILYGNQLIYVMMRDPSDPLRRKMTAEPGKRNSPASDWPWTFVRSFDKSTGKPLWTESVGTSVHNTPRLGFINKKPYIFHARGGGHRPPETPDGVSMTAISGDAAGKTIWSYESPKSAAYVVSHFDDQYAYVYENTDLVVLNSKTGSVEKRIPLYENVDLRLWDSKLGKYQTFKNESFTLAAKKFKPLPTNQTSILVGDYLLFQTHEGHCIGRVTVKTGKVEYLQVPRQVVRSADGSEEKKWDEHIPSDGTNSRGLAVASDGRSKGDGWGHVTSGSPIAVNHFAYFSSMIGMTYVVDTSAKTFNENALVAINNLGPAGGTWSLSAPSYAQGKIFHRGLKHIICIEAEK